VNVSRDSDLQSGFATLVEAGAGALAIAGGPFLNSKRNQLVALAEHYRIPVIYEFREAVVVGGLMSYGPSIPDVYRQVGVYTGRILKGEKPANLPVVQPTKFDLAINLKTAKALGLTVPLIMQMTADEVIE
jgi:putative ABC transport system substrate-binding protein